MQIVRIVNQFDWCRNHIWTVPELFVVCMRMTNTVTGQLRWYGILSFYDHMPYAIYQCQAKTLQIDKIMSCSYIIELLLQYKNDSTLPTHDHFAHEHKSWKMLFVNALAAIISCQTPINKIMDGKFQNNIQNDSKIVTVNYNSELQCSTNTCRKEYSKPNESQQRMKEKSTVQPHWI